MRKIIISILCMILLSSLASATIIINQQPAKAYNLGDFFSIPITIKTPTDISGVFKMELICNGHEVEFYRNGVGLSAGEEKEMNPSLVLTKNMIGEIKGTCKIKGTFNEEYILTEDFKISDYMEIYLTTEERVFNPGQNIILKGGATKENGEDVNGFLELEFLTGNDTTINKLDTISNGFFLVNFSLPEDMKAGEYSVRIKGYEQDSEGLTTNEGSIINKITISQVATSLELGFETQEVEPGTSLKVKAILHDQTGEKISTNASIFIKDPTDEIMEQIDTRTDEFFEYPIANNEPVGEWTVIVKSVAMESEANFEIIEKHDVEVEIINKTLIITNVGNTPYNDSVLIKIGNESMNIDVKLEIDGIQKYILSAPDGEYQIEIITEEGSEFAGTTVLTGNAIDIKKASGGITNIARYPFVWVFIIGILGFVAFTVFKKGYKRSFIGRVIPLRKKKVGGHEDSRASPLRKNSLIHSNNKAELSLSIKGDKQTVSIIGIKIKNLSEVESKKSGSEEVLQKVVNLAEDQKAATYENQDNIFFIFAPLKTRTFKNNKPALEIAQKISNVLTGYNKMAKQKIDFGISLNEGTIVAKQEPSSMKFMSMGTLITMSKKIATISTGEVLLSEKIKEKLTTEVKTEKHTKGNTPYYSINQIKKQNKDNEKFIKNFLTGIEKDKQRQQATKKK